VAPALRSLHEALGRALHGLGRALEARAWRAHVTLARRARGALPPHDALSPLHWRVERAVLVQSHGGRYIVLASTTGAQ
jgi:2'-5' RNA ligase